MAYGRKNCCHVVNAASAGTFNVPEVFPGCPTRKQKEHPLDLTEELNRFLSGVERRAFTMARFATGNADEALDVIQDAMLDFVKRYSGRPAGEWSVLFYRILQSRITDWYRRTSVRNRFRHWFAGNDDDEGEDPLQRIADPSSPDPAKELMRRNAAEELENAVRQLPLRQRQAFLLRAWEGLDVAQTASAMGCSEGSVKTHFSRAVHTLRALLEEYRP
jgi:RNA polymerase sigma-70 factor, ECF subfamily